MLTTWTALVHHPRIPNGRREPGLATSTIRSFKTTGPARADQRLTDSTGLVRLVFHVQEMNARDYSRVAPLILAVGLLVGCGDQRRSVAGVDYCVPAELIAEVDAPWWVPSDLPSGEAVRVKLASSAMADLNGYTAMVGAWGQSMQPHLRIDNWSRWQAWSDLVPGSHYAKLLANPSTLTRKIPGTAFTVVFTSPDQSRWIVVGAPSGGTDGHDELKQARLVAVCSRPTSPTGKEVSANSASCFRVLRDGAVALAYDFAAANVSISVLMDERVRRFAAQLRCTKP